MTEKYKTYVSAHLSAQTAPICPSTFQLVIAIDALMSLVTDLGNTNLQPELQGMDSHAPMCMDDSKCIWLNAERSKENHLMWDWNMTSYDVDDTSKEAILHVSGRIAFRYADDVAYLKDFARYERLVRRQRCLALLDQNEADGVIHGTRNIYKAFGETVQYKDDLYKGLQRIVGKDNESAGRIVIAHKGETFLDLGLIDAFCQVAGIFLNSMTDHPDGDMYISDWIDQWTASPILAKEPRPTVWEVFACHHRPSDKECISDVFIFDPVKDRLTGVILGIHYVKVSRIGMGKLLTRLSGSQLRPRSALPTAPAEIPMMNDKHRADNSIIIEEGKEGQEAFITA